MPDTVVHTKVHSKHLPGLRDNLEAGSRKERVSARIRCHTEGEARRYSDATNMRATTALAIAMRSVLIARILV